jgi:hypothetical protein
MTEREERAVMALAIGDLLAALPPAEPGRAILRRAFGYNRSLGPVRVTPQQRALDAARAATDGRLEQLRSAAQLALEALGRELSAGDLQAVGDGQPVADLRAPTWPDEAFRGV